MRAGAALATAVAVAVGLGVTPSPAGAARPASFRPFDASALSRPSADGGSIDPAAAAITVTANSTCWSQQGADPHGDAAAPDAVSFALSFDCSTKAWKMTTTAASAFSSSALGGFFLNIESDGNFTNHCNGADLQVIGGWNGQKLVGQVRSIQDCDHLTVTANVTASRPSTKSVQVAFTNTQLGNPSEFQWYMGSPEW